jgi:hypothetical protein
MTKLTLYRLQGSGKWRLPGFLDNRHIKVARILDRRTGRFHPSPNQEVFLVLTSVTGWVDPRATMRPKGLSLEKAQWPHRESNPWNTITCSKIHHLSPDILRIPDINFVCTSDRSSMGRFLQCADTFTILTFTYSTKLHTYTKIPKGQRKFHTIN